MTRFSPLAPRVWYAVPSWLTLALVAIPFHAARSQRVLGSIEDASVVPRGSIRVSAGVSFSRAEERFASGHPGGAARGVKEPFGSSYSFDTLGTIAVERLAPLTQPLRSLSGQQALNLSLGALDVAMNRDVRTIPMSIDAGLTSRLTVGVLVPYHFVYNTVGVIPGGGGNVGMNPAATFTAARTTNGAVVSQIAGASNRLRALLTSCAADPSGAGCGPINANRQQAALLVAQSDAAAADIVTVYGDATRVGSPFAPIVGSALEQAIFARLNGFNASYQMFLGLPVDSVLIGARPVGATRLTQTDVNTIVVDSAVGIIAQPLANLETGHLGDIEVSAKLLLFDSFQGSTSRRLAPSSGVKARLSVGAAYRFATGTRAAPDNFVDLGTGDGIADIEARGYLDLILGNRFWFSSVVRYGMPRTDTATARISDTTAFSFPAAYRQQNATLARGTYIEAEWAPRLVLNDFFALAGYYRYRRTERDEYTGTFTVNDLTGASRTLDAASLGAFSDTEEHRAGIALSYSTIAAYATRRARLPLELTVLLTRVVQGAGVPVDTQAALSVRFYHKVFGPNNLRR